MRMHLKAGVLFIISAYIFTSCISRSGFNDAALRPWHFSGKAQGTTYHITYYAAAESVLKFQFDSVFSKMDSSLSIYKPYSLISRFNEGDGEVVMDEHMKPVILKSVEIYNKTGGLFDITVYPFTQIWGFGTREAASLPDSAFIRSLLPCVGTDKLQVNHNRLKKLKACVKIDVNGIAQGYTVDVIANFLEKKGVQNYVVEVGGEIRVKGRKYPGKNLFQIGVESPSEDEFEEPVIEKVLLLKGGAVTTSGNYRRYYESDGKIINHLINASTGYPLQNELISVTVVAKDAMTADGYDNALMGMGLQKSFKFLRGQKKMEAYFVYHDKNGNVKDTATSGFYKLLKQ